MRAAEQARAQKMLELGLLDNKLDGHQSHRDQVSPLCPSVLSPEQQNSLARKSMTLTQ